MSPVNIIAGPGTLQSLPQEAQRLKVNKAMIYADPGVVQAGLVEQVTDVLQQAGLEFEIYSNIVPEPPIDVADQAVNALRESDVDFVIGIGGGSSLDIAKTAATLYGNPGSVKDYLNLTGTKTIQHKGLPRILIPTTSGTGAEVTDIAVFSLEKTKDVITHPLMMADTALVDAELTYKLPAKITAATGVDALTHAVEAFISMQATPLTDTLALEAMRLISNNIRQAVWQGKNNPEARQKMAWGSLIAGLSFYNAGVSGVHALAYPLGGLFKIPHGESNAVLLPYVFDYVWPSCLDKMVRMAEAFEVYEPGVSPRQNALNAVQALYDLVQDVGIPTSLKDFGIQEKDLQLLSEEAIQQKRLLARSPKPYTVDDILAIYQQAYVGRS
ncbi:iron-containing alcohol dehydrogenase [Caldalkalibacillus uzonensis]